MGVESSIFIEGLPFCLLAESSNSNKALTILLSTLLNLFVGWLRSEAFMAIVLTFAGTVRKLKPK